MIIIWFFVALVILWGLWSLCTSSVNRLERKAKALEELTEAKAEIEAEEIRKAAEALRNSNETKESK